MANTQAALALKLSLGLFASLMLAVGLTMMKARASALPIARGRRILRAIFAWTCDPLWLGGLVVQTTGYALYMVAQAGAPVSMMAVAMQGGIALFVVLAVVVLGEHARIWEWMGIGVFMGAALMLAGSLGAGAVQGPPDVTDLLLSSVTAAAIASLLLLTPRLRQNGVTVAIASGIALGFASLYTKP